LWICKISIGDVLGYANEGSFQLQQNKFTVITESVTPTNLLTPTLLTLHDPILQQDLEGTLHHLQIDNARMDAELKHERQRVEQLLKDLQDSQKVFKQFV
jgi:hypothetical protein